ncbi:MAG: hypothetical protein HY609_06180 [Deltaproteobacteria bacterium]|nr:hypothetical protein [Deltaproteobacteria bacterium]
MHAKKQYTIRGIPERVDKTLKKKAKDEGKSLNSVLVECLERAAGEGVLLEFDDLDGLIGAWANDPECDRALASQDRIDNDLWK